MGDASVVLGLGLRFGLLGAILFIICNHQEDVCAETGSEYCIKCKNTTGKSAAGGVSWYWCYPPIETSKKKEEEKTRLNRTLANT